MELLGERLIPATVDQTWAALNDPAVLKACIAGCESLEPSGENAFSAVVAVKVGPVSARFKGNLQMTNIVPPNSYTINFDGQGGVAGFGKGSADVALTPEGTQTMLKYNARAQVGGKMAQVGSRLIDAAAGKITEDFFKAFEAHLQASGAAAGGELAAPAPAAVAPAGGGNRVLWIGAALVLVVLIYFLFLK
jgi:carbon monoxide dehydrogenase subunit G